MQTQLPPSHSLTGSPRDQSNQLYVRLRLGGSETSVRHGASLRWVGVQFVMFLVATPWVHRPKGSIKFCLTATHSCSTDNWKKAAKLYIRAPTHYTQRRAGAASRSQRIPATELSKDGRSTKQGWHRRVPSTGLPFVRAWGVCTHQAAPAGKAAPWPQHPELLARGNKTKHCTYCLQGWQQHSPVKFSAHKLHKIIRICRVWQPEPELYLRDYELGTSSPHLLIIVLFPGQELRS